MKRTSSDVLEFAALRELLGRYIASPIGRARLEEVEPHGDRARAEALAAAFPQYDIIHGDATDLSVLADDSAAIRFVVECIARTPDLYVRAIEGHSLATRLRDDLGIDSIGLVGLFYAVVDAVLDPLFEGFDPVRTGGAYADADHPRGAGRDHSARQHGGIVSTIPAGGGSDEGHRGGRAQ